MGIVRFVFLVSRFERLERKRCGMELFNSLLITCGISRGSLLAMQRFPYIVPPDADAYFTIVVMRRCRVLCIRRVLV
jgi:hypothetical protein